MIHTKTSRILLGILAAGVIAAVLDIIYAFVLAGMRGSTPVRVLQSIASGVLGREAFSGGNVAAALGMLLHTAILVVAAGLYFAAAWWSVRVRNHYLLFGTAFGIGVYLVMNFVVLPLSAVPFKIAYSPQVLAQGFISHALVVGIPIAMCLRAMCFSPAREA